jgi:hypothetical protein
MIIDRINAWVLNRLPSRRSTSEISVTVAGLTVKDLHGVTNIDWKDIAEVVATRSEQIVGNTLLLIISLTDGRALTVPENTPAWRDLTMQLPHYLPGAKSYQEWVLHTAFSEASEASVAVTIFKKST